MRVPVMAMTALLMIAGVAAAEPPKAAPVKRPQPTQPAQSSAEIMLASAEAMHVPTADPSPASLPPKPRVVPRVTHCRCGDPQVDPESQDQ